MLTLAGSSPLPASTEDWTPIDADDDGVCDVDDVCPGFDDNADADGDTVPDGCDLCPGFDDNFDGDHDGVPDGCDLCVGNDASGNGDGDAICTDFDCDDADPTNACEVFRDGFESGDTAVWSSVGP